MEFKQHDSDLWQKLRRKDRFAFETVYVTYRKWLVITAMTILNDEARAEDLVQQFFTNLWNAAAIENSQEVNSIKDFLYISIRNRCLNEIKSSQAKKRQFDSTQVPNWYEPPTNILEAKELRAEIHNAIGQLPKMQATVFELGYLHRKTHQQIANELGLSENTVRNHMVLALKNLRNRLKDKIN